MADQLELKFGEYEYWNVGLNPVRLPGVTFVKEIPIDSIFYGRIKSSGVGYFVKTRLGVTRIPGNMSHAWSNRYEGKDGWSDYAEVYNCRHLKHLLEITFPSFEADCNEEARKLSNYE